MILSYLSLTRPINVLLTFASVWLAAFISPQFQADWCVFWAGLSAALIAAGGNIVNDLFDLEIDRLNRPQRVLASGKVSVRNGWIFYFTLTFIGIVLAGYLGLVFLWIAVPIVLVLFWYSARLKATVLWGNFTVSLVSAFTFIYGALAVQDWQAGIIPAVFAFFFHFGREIIKDMQDVDGDLALGVKTLPGKYGFRAAIIWVNLLFMLLIILTLLPYIFYSYPVIYLWLVVAGVDSVLLFVSVLLWFRRDRQTLGQLSRLLKLDMLVGLIAVWLGTHHVIFFNY